jgi:hypothetical protein
MCRRVRAVNSREVRPQSTRLICPSGKSMGEPNDFLSIPAEKNISFRRSVETDLLICYPASQEGRFAVVTDVGCGMRWTRAAPLTKAWACGRRSRVVLTPRRWRQVGAEDGAGDGDKQARSPGRARRKPLKPLRREGRVFRRTCGSTPVLFCCTGGCGCAKHPAFPAPSLLEGGKFLAYLGRIASREGENVSAKDGKDGLFSWGRYARKHTCHARA